MIKHTSPKLDTLNFLKLLAVIGIIGCHTGYLTGFAACSRMVEVLFVISGFLMAYNHDHETTTPTGWQIVKRKLSRFYPLHLTGFFLQAVFVTTWARKSLSFFLSVGILNLGLQQAWFADTQFSYNGVSWYLSALLFAYAMTPQIKRFVKTFAPRPFGLLKAFILVTLVRYYCDYLVINAPHYIHIDLHSNPFVQMLNYTLGYIAGAFFLEKNFLNTTLKQNLSPTETTVLQTIFVLFYIAVCYRFDGACRTLFIVTAVPPVFISALNQGLYRRIALIKPVKYLSMLTLEIFMLHSFILYKIPTPVGDYRSLVIFLSVTLLSAMAYHTIYTLVYKYLKNRHP